MINVNVITSRWRHHVLYGFLLHLVLFVQLYCVADSAASNKHHSRGLSQKVCIRVKIYAFCDAEVCIMLHDNLSEKQLWPMNEIQILSDIHRPSNEPHFLDWQKFGKSDVLLRIWFGLPHPCTDPIQTIEESEKSAPKEETNENNKKKSHKLNIFSGLKKKEIPDEKHDEEKASPVHTSDEETTPCDNVMISSPL